MVDSRKVGNFDRSLCNERLRTRERDFVLLEFKNSDNVKSRGATIRFYLEPIFGQEESE